MEEQLVKPELDEFEEQEAEERVAVTARVVHEAIRKQGEEELKRSSSALAWSGLAAGLSMGFSFVAEALLRAHLPETEWRTLITKLGYPLGFLIVIIGRQQLFTENTLTPIIPLLARRNMKTFRSVLRLWTVVFLANMVGAHLFAWALGNTAVLSPEAQHAMSDIGHEVAGVGFGAAILRGVFAGWLIALVVWILAASEHSQIGVIVILTYAVGLGQFTHIIAGSIEVLFLVTTGQLAWTAFAAGYAIPTLIGNILGGVSFVSVLNHAQVVSGTGKGGQSGNEK
jgi:formate/nitrite transporter FocA (FNT family)